ncbi:MAG TPA: hypothetical protein PLG34_09330 [Spirochaetota bacterium]|jgi:1,4-alpha-glucan branching enzyme|nr:MAG: hypothetical protein BWX91_02154 [Spirochaetes bacterium ADurb.Bin133]HNZ26265.1 hypothetical protein [Spirochaetota bacterium]HPY88171.1 hypothetical protein [Spirochaetota bacterium]
MKNKICLILTLFATLNLVDLFAVEEYVDFELIKKASAPRYLAKGVLLTLPETAGRNIFVRTDSNNWETDYRYSKSLYGVWYLFLPYPRDRSEMLYKVNIDGSWDSDPTNNRFILDKFQTKISILEIPAKTIYYRESPILSEDKGNVKKAYFRYYDPDAKEANLVCSKDNWSIFSHPMTLNKDNYWEIELRFSKGKYFYYFLVDWKKKIDMNNPKRVWNSELGEVSYFIAQ